jgi:hypothetical protein
MAKKQLFESNPLENHPMFSGSTETVEKKPEKVQVKKTKQPAEIKSAVEIKKAGSRPAPKKEPIESVEFRKSTFYLTDEIHKGIKLYAVQNDIDISVLVRQVFADFLKNKGVEI